MISFIHKIWVLYDYFVNYDKEKGPMAQVKFMYISPFIQLPHNYQDFWLAKTFHISVVRSFTILYSKCEISKDTKSWFNISLELVK